MNRKSGPLEATVENVMDSDRMTQLLLVPGQDQYCPVGLRGDTQGLRIARKLCKTPGTSSVL